MIKLKSLLKLRRKMRRYRVKISSRSKIISRKERRLKNKKRRSLCS